MGGGSSVGRPRSLAEAYEQARGLRAPLTTGLPEVIDLRDGAADPDASPYDSLPWPEEVRRREAPPVVVADVEDLTPDDVAIDEGDDEERIPDGWRRLVGNALVGVGVLLIGVATWGLTREDPLPASTVLDTTTTVAETTSSTGTTAAPSTTGTTAAVTSTTVAAPVVGTPTTARAATPTTRPSTPTTRRPTATTAPPPATTAPPTTAAPTTAPPTTEPPTTAPPTTEVPTTTLPDPPPAP